MFEWAIVMITLLFAVAIGATPFSVSATFKEVFREFGTIDELPLLTQLVIRRSFGLTCGAVTAMFAVLALLTRRRVLLRKVFLGVGGVAGLVSIGVYLLGVYAPILELTDVTGP